MAAGPRSAGHRGRCPGLGASCTWPTVARSRRRRSVEAGAVTPMRAIRGACAAEGHGGKPIRGTATATRRRGPRGLPGSGLDPVPGVHRRGRRSQRWRRPGWVPVSTCAMPCSASGPHGQTESAALGEQAGQRTQRGSPGARRAPPVRVVQQHGATAGQICEDRCPHGASVGVRRPVPAPGRPQHRPQPGAAGSGQAATGEDAVRRPVPLRNGPADLPYRADGARHLPYVAQRRGEPGGARAASRAPRPRDRPPQAPGQGPDAAPASCRRRRRWPAPGTRPGRAGSVGCWPGPARRRRSAPRGRDGRARPAPG